MAMRTDCRHYESRTYPSGETVKKCRLDLAPEAPWRCPENCPSFAKRRFDAGWDYGSFAQNRAPGAPEPSGDAVAALLDEAESIVNSAAPDALAEVDADQKRRKGLRGKLRRRKRR